MKPEHTPGLWVGIEDGKYRETPWILDHEDDHDATWLPITNAAGRTIALVVNDDTKRPLKMHERETEANARRIVACVNACEGIATDQLEAYAEKVGKLLSRANMHDELLEALEDLARLAEAAMLRANYDGGEYDIEGELAAARAAIRKARGESHGD